MGALKVSNENALDKLPSIDLISHSLKNHILSEITKIDSQNAGGANVPFDLIHSDNHFEQMERAFVRGIKNSLSEMTANYTKVDFEYLISHLNKPVIIMNLSRAINSDFGEIASFDFGNQINKDFGETIKFSALPIMINLLNAEVSSFDKQRNGRHIREEAKPFGTKILNILGKGK